MRAEIVREPAHHSLVLRLPLDDVRALRDLLAAVSGEIGPDAQFLLEKLRAEVLAAIALLACGK